VVAVLASAPTAIGATSAVPPDYHHIANHFNHLCLGVAAGGKAAGTNVIVWPCGEYADHYWSWGGPNGKELVNLNSGLCLGPVGERVQDGQPLEQQACTGGRYQQWTMAWDPHNQAWVYYVDNDGGSNEVLSIQEPVDQGGSRAILYHINSHWSSDQYWD
jgi:hypothetical protein